jgi:hypothetical protein
MATLLSALSPASGDEIAVDPGEGAAEKLVEALIMASPAT